MQQPILDLHTHSNRSDGLDTPAYLITRAKQLGVDVLALADHDTTDGWNEASEKAQELEIGFIPAIEISTHSKIETEAGTKRISVHVLAYRPDRNHPRLVHELARTRDSRVSRARRMVELIEKDYPISWQEITENIRPGSTVGRPAIADALVRAGVVQDRSKAFDSILHKSSPYYISEHSLETVDAIELAKQAGAATVIAHPLMDFPAGKSISDLSPDHFLELVEAGLDGLEVDHRQVPEPARDWLKDFAKAQDLFVTGSSDYHGVGGKVNELGENSTTVENFQRLISASSGADYYLPAGLELL
jgi:predicted metal-dependent phosphoesterase TrpH